MATIDIAAPMARLIAVLQSGPLVSAGLQNAITGAPESFGFQVSGFVALASSRLIDKAAGLAQLEARYRVGFGYTVEGAESTAEIVLAAVLGAFIVAMLVERRTDMNGTVDSVSLELGAGGDPQYVTLAGQESRLIEVDVVTTQQQTY